jgi:hypothetical protein
VIDICYDPCDYEPMEGVPVDVQDHARRIGTHGEMISSDLHGAEESTRWMLRPQQGAETGQSIVPGKTRRIHQRQLRRPAPRGVEPSLRRTKFAHTRIIQNTWNITK